jgi:hypothetical protein
MQDNVAQIQNYDVAHSPRTSAMALAKVFETNSSFRDRHPLRRTRHTPARAPDSVPCEFKVGL